MRRNKVRKATCIPVRVLKVTAAVGERRERQRHPPSNAPSLALVAPAAAAADVLHGPELAHLATGMSQRRLRLLLALLAFAITAVSAWRHTIKLGILMEGRRNQSEKQRRAWVQDVVWMVNKKTRHHDVHVQVVDFSFLPTLVSTHEQVEGKALKRSLSRKSADIMQAWTTDWSGNDDFMVYGDICNRQSIAIVKHTDRLTGWVSDDEVARRVLHALLTSIGLDNSIVIPESSCPCPETDCVLSSNITSWSSAVLPNCTRILLEQKIKIDGCTSKHSSAAAVMAICGNGIVEAGEECDCTIADAAANAECDCCTTSAKQCNMSQEGKCKPQGLASAEKPGRDPGLDHIPIAVTASVLLLIMAVIALFFTVRHVSQRKIRLSMRSMWSSSTPSSTLSLTVDR